MGRESDRYGWNSGSNAGWDSDASGGRSNPGRGSGFGGSGQGWRGQERQEDGSGGGRYQGGDDGWGGWSGSSGPQAPQWGESTRSSGPYSQGGYGRASGPSRAGYPQSGPSSHGGSGADSWGADPYLNRPFDAGFHGAPGYGQPSPSSQSWQAAPSRPVEQTWESMPQWGQPSPWGTEDMGSPEVRSRGKSHRRLWITLAVVAILLVTGAAGAVFAVQYFGPIGTVNRFCGTLKAQSYTAAYSMLSSHMQGTITQDDFANDAVTLDRAEGSVLDCGARSVGIGDNFHFGASSAAFSVSIKRSGAGTLSGVLSLANESGSWKISALDTNLLGVNLGAIQAANAYCTALQSQAYSAAYALLGKSQTATTKQADYSQQGQWHDQVDGTVSLCQVVGVTPGNSDALASLSVSVTRGKLGKKQDVIALDIENSTWKITAIGAQLQGTDIGGIQVTARFCSDLSHNNYTDLYSLLDGNFVGTATEPYVAELFDGQYNGIKFTGCTFDATTYKLSGTTATIPASFNLLQLSTGARANAPAKLKLVRYGHTWKLDDATIT